jgi:hypothetical protein
MHNNGKHPDPTVVPLLLAVLLALWSTPAYSQAPFPRPTVTRAIDLIDNYPVKIPIGTDVVFKRKTANTGRALVQSGVQVRVFTLGENENRPQPITTVADCDVYLSVVYRLRSAADLKDLELRFVKMDQGWIQLTNSQNSTKDGRWYLVFEQSLAGAPQEQFRIRSTDAKDYFDTGFLITVYDNGSIPFDKIKAEYEKRSDSLTRLYREIDQKDLRVPCYSYRRLTVDAKAESVVAYAELEICAAVDDVM